MLGCTDCTQSEKPKVLMVLTSHDKLGETDQQTGWYLPEAAHPFDVFTEAGYEMEWASPKGGVAPLDESSIEATKEDASCVSFATDEKKKKLWSETKALSDCKSADYSAVFFVGGFGTMWDFPDNEDVQRISREIYEAGGVVSAVCHGPCALVNVKLSNGELLMKGKEVSAFTNDEEDAVQRREIVPWTNEDKFTEIGAKFVKADAWGVSVVVADRVVTGQNPPSAKGTAEAVVAALS